MGVMDYHLTCMPSQMKSLRVGDYASPSERSVTRDMDGEDDSSGSDIEDDVLR
jgi:hypothetical protein